MRKIFVLIIALIGLIQFACKKDRSGSGQPIIDNVRLVDTAKRDSFFTSAMPGALIVIQGSNLDDAKAIYFNDTAAYFNPVYATGSNIIVNIPSTAPTAATNPSVPNTIKLVTSHGTATFNFRLYLPPPVISSISLDNNGKFVYIKGANFKGVKKITFPVPGADTALSYKVNASFTQIEAEIPPGIAFTDSLRVYCTFGTAAYAYPPPMIIAGLSNENAAAGTTITISGTNFIGISKVIFPGGKLGTNIQNISVSQVAVTVPAGITSTDSLRMQGALGTVTAPQLFASYLTHPSPGYLSTFDQQWAADNTAFVGWTGGYADDATSQTSYPNATGGVAVLLQSAPMGANAGPTSQGNPGLLQLNPVPWVSNTSASVNDYAMKFEVYVATPWTAGELWISIGGWYSWNSYTARFAPWETAPNSKYQPSGWVTVTIPLKNFIKGNEYWKTAWNPAGAQAAKFSDYPATDVAFLIANDQAVAVPSKTINIAIDNVRIVKEQ